ncbi:MAG: polysaccharide export protein [Paludibacter sp.]|nr:polysaccharide export protein [Bacteroidales bacterium]MCM1069452.1 polysaccharide export protein [Prevotella sp.]MCM1353826.1 polysaccharide export protein [Bacteroides sp.]MCM1442774.1 polysaccharide export protein [Muribaculum sp.]MCM1481862.1 polysaccharide export protein [Paludibacter sp.]
MAYFKTVNEQSADSINLQFHAAEEPSIFVGDQLLITITALDPDAAAPFNLPLVTYMTPGAESAGTTPNVQSYIVDKDGNINFPILGKLHVAGLSKSEAIALISDKISSSIKDPIVNIRFMNYHVTVMGEVNRPGRYTITDERVSILDALAMAGDMTVYGQRDNILLTRENNGKLEFARLNLNDKDIFTSPYFYLQQNDVLYIEPNKVRAVSSQNVSLYLSMVTTLGSLATVIVSVVTSTK